VPFGRVLDDQERRARELAAAGACLLCEPLTEIGLTESIAKLADTPTRHALAKISRASIRNNGATSAAQAILDIA
jgi:UDP-N-acetylglucosamine--N-acetylmuramyl-(pentapeptide) pyrophosphoryl-undecaprenol N-acetylglucosamine transferase